MKLKKQFDEYIKSRQPGHKTGWEYMNLDEYDASVILAMI